MHGKDGRVKLRLLLPTERSPIFIPMVAHFANVVKRKKKKNICGIELLNAWIFRNSFQRGPEKSSIFLGPVSFFFFFISFPSCYL